ncbi:MAG TPA: helix-turn-helix domain-containing protein [Ktedonobacteraceae bacterium]|nr:helix-turn-helix domain-containing protein [Ktedonobacteraceae bacterium]
MIRQPLFSEQLRYEREQRGWSQADLAERAQCETKTIGRWESGKSLPRPFHRQRLCEIFGKSMAELGLAPLPRQPLTPVDADDPGGNESVQATLLEEAARTDWGEAPYMTSIYGRDRECAELTGWLKDPQCRMGAIIGMGGVGKTAIATMVARQNQQDFDCVFWRSLQNAPPLEHFLQQCIRFVSHQERLDLPPKTDDQILLLIEYLRKHACLLVLDNFESLLEPGQNAGHYRPTSAAYGQLLRRVGEVQHGSFLLLTSREKPREIELLEGKTRPVRSLSLSGLQPADGQAMLKERELIGSDEHWNTLITSYSGNPLALQLVSRSIEEIFEGQIERFLQKETIAFGDINDLVDQQFRRLSLEEQEVLYWLALEREAISLDELSKNLLYPLPSGTLFAVLGSLRRRSLIERREPALFTLQPVIMEYVITNLVAHATREFESEIPGVWLRYAFTKAQARGYVRASQEHLLLARIAQSLLIRLGKEGIAQRVRALLDRQRQTTAQLADYLAGNLLNLLNYLQWPLQDYDFSQVVIREAYLQGAILAGVDFTGAHFIAPRFTSTFGNILSVACHPQGQVIAAGTTSGEIWIYNASTYALLMIFRGHSDGVWSLAFSPDGSRLASSSDDHTVCLWDTASGDCLNLLRGHSARVRAVAFSANGQLLASGSDDQTIRLWDVASGTCLSTLEGHTDRVWSLSFSRDGRLLASGSTDQTVRLWHVTTVKNLLTLHGHTGWIRSLAFHPDGEFLASTGNDHTIRLWQTSSGVCTSVLRGHTNRVWSLAFSPDGHYLASGSEDQTIRLWKVATGRTTLLLTGHTQGVRSLAFAPDRQTLISGGDDQTVRVWDTASGHMLQTIQGYTNRIMALAFSPDGSSLASSSEDFTTRIWNPASGQCERILRDRTHSILALAFHPAGHVLASGGPDQTIRLWELDGGAHFTTLRGHTDWIRALAFSPDGARLASGGEDHTIRLWDLASGDCLTILQGHTSWIRALAFSPDGSRLVSGSDDHTIRLWDLASGQGQQTLTGHSDRVRTVLFSRDGQTIISGSEDQSIRLWDVASGQLRQTLTGHTSWARSLSLNADGRLLASGSEDRTIRLWDLTSGECLAVLRGHTNRVRWVAFHPTHPLLASGGDDGLLKLWDAHTGNCLNTLISERPYEQMKIARAQGLSEAQKANLYALGASEEA